MTLYLHVGTHKTGTTSIQKFAAEHRTQFRKRGLWYPGFDLIGKSPHYAHHPLAWGLAEERDRGDLSVADAMEFAKRVTEKRRLAEDVLLSAEPAYRLGIGGGGFWEERRRYVERLREALPSDDVEVVICLRDQLDFARSLYQERVKVTKYSRPFTEFIENERHHFEYDKAIDVFDQAFGRVRVILYEDLSSTGSVVNEFFSALGFDFSGLPEGERENSSFSLELVEFKRLMNMSSISRAKEKRLRSRLINVANRFDAVSADWLAPDDAQAFRESFEDINERVRNRWLPARACGLFVDRPKPSKPEFAGLSAERAADIATHLIP